MTEYRISEGLYLLPTPAGAYYAVSGIDKNPSRELLKAILSYTESPLLSVDSIKEWIKSGDDSEAYELLYHAQSLGWLEGFEEPKIPPTDALENILPVLLPDLSSNGKALLADGQGFYVASAGFPHEAAEELSALSADVANLHERHGGLLNNNLGLNSGAWALVDTAGNSQIGFWPLFIGAQRFVLVISGTPRLNQPALTSLIWTLSIRYGSTGSE
ncbi:MAG: hypothetical protein MI754_02615 [Chromatiales bacterium]|nr:hypothetical protein [Chromatiales bacterium]